MTIISQDYELINFDKLAKVTMYEGEVDGTTVYAIVGFESASSDDAEISGDSDTVLGIYSAKMYCLLSLKRSKPGKRSFRCPNRSLSPRK